MSPNLILADIIKSFTDGTALIADLKEKLKESLDKVKNESKKKGLSVN